MNQTNVESQRDPRVERCELCIVGAGIAGLNALYAASRYLSPDDRVILVDRNPQPGGMWINTYDYVRLHQPHPFFTAGNIEWALGAAPEHLASKSEILDHFRYCIDELRNKVTLVELFGHSYLRHQEVAVDGGFEPWVSCAPLAGEGQPVLIKARRLIKAFGFSIPENDPLDFSSPDVRSISPHASALFGEEMERSEKPVYIIGGGKTAMDTAHELITRFPGKDINLVVGKGTRFANRNKSFPTGLKRWWSGNMALGTFLDVALRYDGTNDHEVFEYWSEHYSVGLGDGYERFFLGLLSEEENQVIADGVNHVFVDYLADIVACESGPKLKFKSGESFLIEPGSWIVNCTGYVLRDRRDYEPYLSEHGTVVSIQPSSGIHILTTFAAYFLVHLFYLDKLRSVPLYELNYHELLERNRVGFSFVCMTQILYNIMQIVDAVPLSVMNECGLDFDRWYPLPRRLLGAMKLKRHKRDYAEHFKSSLDTVRNKYGLAGGVLPSVRENRRTAALA